jgi:hypothetical protein
MWRVRKKMGLPAKAAHNLFGSAGILTIARFNDCDGQIVRISFIPRFLGRLYDYPNYSRNDTLRVFKAKAVCPWLQVLEPVYFPAVCYGIECTFIIPFLFRPPSPVSGKAVKNQGGKVLTGRKPTLVLRSAGAVKLRMPERTNDA